MDHDTRIGSSTAPDIIRMLNAKADLHRFLDDYPGALITYNQALVIAETAFQPSDSTDRLNHQAEILLEKAFVLSLMSRFGTSGSICDQIMVIWSRLIEETGDSRYRHKLACTFRLSANNLLSITDYETARYHYDSALEIWNALDLEINSEAYTLDIANTCYHKALTFSACEEFDTARQNLDGTIRLLEQYRKSSDLNLSSDLLANAYSGIANITVHTGDLETCHEYYDKAIALREKLIRDGVIPRFNYNLAVNYHQKGWAYSRQNDSGKAVKCYEKCNDIVEAMVYHEGRSDQVGFLAKLSMSMANCMHDLRRYDEAGELYEKTFAILKKLIEEQGKAQLRINLAMAYMNRSMALESLGEYAESLTFIDKSLVEWKLVCAQTKGGHLIKYVGWLKSIKAKVLLQLGEIEPARSCAEEAVRILESETPVEYRSDMESALLDAQTVLKSINGANRHED